jgi:hypothetical protein
LEIATIKSQLYTSYNDLFLQGNKTACELLDADRATIWLVDHETNVLWSKVADGVPVIRIPKKTGIVGYVVDHGHMLNIKDAYQDDRFNKSVDQSTGYKTKTILCCPVQNELGDTIGALQVINKKKENNTTSSSIHFTDEDEIIIESLCQHLRLAFETCTDTNKDSNDIPLPLPPTITDEKNNTKGINMLSLSTEALLRFELKHSVSTSKSRGSFNDGIISEKSSDDGNSDDDSTTSSSIDGDNGGHTKIPIISMNSLGQEISKSDDDDYIMADSSVSFFPAPPLRQLF